MAKTLYERLGGYDAIAAVAESLVSKLRADEKLGRFWAHRGSDGITREIQLLIDFLCANAGGPVYYRGRDMKLSHTGMRIDENDWSALTQHLKRTLDEFSVPDVETQEALGFVESLRNEIVDV